MDPQTVTIGKAVYEQLLKDSEMLAALEAAGVDNWEGYGEAVRSLDKNGGSRGETGETGPIA